MSEYLADRPEVKEWIESGDRWQVLGIWRPLKTVARDPLVLTDSRSVPATDYRDLSREKVLGGKKLYICWDHSNDA
jgi:hypothetical protein